MIAVQKALVRVAAKASQDYAVRGPQLHPEIERGSGAREHERMVHSPAQRGTHLSLGVFGSHCQYEVVDRSVCRPWRVVHHAYPDLVVEWVAAPAAAHVVDDDGVRNVSGDRPHEACVELSDEAVTSSLRWRAPVICGAGEIPPAHGLAKPVVGQCRDRQSVVVMERREGEGLARVRVDRPGTEGRAVYHSVAPQLLRESQLELPTGPHPRLHVERTVFASCPLDIEGCFAIGRGSWHAAFQQRHRFLAAQGRHSGAVLCA
mmetsp:Transcript_59557/g.98759  ORF Transcript_59557/g.98759 Transcript_59557/m.98759 type:complete len:261 (-) Transcript_59557:255-1037(-)